MSLSVCNGPSHQTGYCLLFPTDVASSFVCRDDGHDVDRSDRERRSNHRATLRCCAEHRRTLPVLCVALRRPFHTSEHNARHLWPPDPSPMPKKRKDSDVVSDSHPRLARHRVASPVSSVDETTRPDAFGVLNRPNARWRQLGMRIRFEMQLDAEVVERVHRLAQVEFYESYHAAVAAEEQRVRHRLAKMKISGRGKRPQARPTDKALSVVTRLDATAWKRCLWLQYMMEKGQTCNQGLLFGHVPGVEIGDVFEYKVQLKLVGVHRIVMAGIDYCPANAIRENSPSLAVLNPQILRQRDESALQISIVLAGGYEDDEDDHSEMIYTGQGGNDLLGRRIQIEDQKLNRGNLALYNNAIYGVPVRVIKKNGSTFIYDGLWDVLQMIKKRGIEGFYVYQYRLRRCPGQQPSMARKVAFKEGQNDRHLDSANLSYPDEICPDFSRGISEIPVSVANDVDDELPPGLKLRDLHEDIRVMKTWKLSRDLFEFGVEMRLNHNVPEPVAPDEVPEAYQERPHAYLISLNHGCLPYQDKGTLHHAMSILYECGPWLRCRNGQNCRQRVTSHPAKWRFQIFKTINRGWGLKTLDLIPVGSFVMKYIGEVYRVEDLPQEDIFCFNMTKRPDYTDDNKWLPSPQAVDAEFAVTGRSYGNLFRFINHSCDPNCFTQPVLSHHLDRSRPDVNIFAMRTIFPGEEICYDYGREYVEKLLANDCRCGAACCIKRDVEIES